MQIRLLIILGYIISYTVSTMLLGWSLRFWVNFLDKKGKMLSERRLPKIRHTLLIFMLFEALTILFVALLTIISIYFSLNPNSRVWDITLISYILLFISYFIYTSILYSELKKMHSKYSILYKLSNIFKALAKNIILKYIYLCCKQIFCIDIIISLMIMALGMNIAQTWGLGIFEFYVAVVLLIPVTLNLWVYLTFKPATKSDSWIISKKDCSKRRGILCFLIVLFSVLYNYYQFSNFVYNNSKLSIEFYAVNLMIVLFLVFDRLFKIWYNDYQDHIKNKRRKLLLLNLSTKRIPSNLK